jgi:hypothetical protein
MELFHFFKNENLRLAFYHRMQGQYRTGFTFLKKASDEDNDGQASFVMGRTYEVGGFGKYPDPALSMEYYRKSARLNCVWAKIVLNIPPKEKIDTFGTFLMKRDNLRDDTFYKCIELCINEGNINVCNYFLFNPTEKLTDIGYLIHDPTYLGYSESLKQRYGSSVFQSAENFKETNPVKCAYLQLKGFGFNIFTAKNVVISPAVSHIYGYWLQKNGRYMFSTFDKSDNQRLVMVHLAFYRANMKYISLSILCAIWVLRQMVHKDVIPMIIRRVWKTRKDFLLWIEKK